MARRRRRGRPKGSNNKAKRGGTRGRKPIFTAAQKRVLDRMIRKALADQLRRVARGL